MKDIFRKLSNALLPPIFGIISRKIKNRALILYKKRDYLINKMERGDFNFTSEEERRLIKEYDQSPSRAPWPKIWRDIWSSKVNAIEANGVEASNVWYSLPYSTKYDVDALPFNKMLIRYTQEHVGSLNGKRVADVGCGKGGLLAECHNKFPDAQLFGIEQSLVAIDYIKNNRANINHILFDARKPLPKDEYDLCFCIETLEHIEHPSIVVKNLLSSLRANGSLIITVPNGRFDSTPQHIHFWSPESWGIFIKNCASGNKFKIDALEDNQMAGNNRNVVIIYKNISN